MFEKIVAFYQFIDRKTEFQCIIKCSVSTVSGNYLISVSESKGFKLGKHEHHEFKTREKANAKFLELKKRYPFKKVAYTGYASY